MNKNIRLSHLDVIKGICILFVIITHYEWTENEELICLFPFWIDMAVPVFMIITGYVTTISFNKRSFRLIENYKPRIVIAKWLRFLIPFIPAYILTVLARIIAQGGIKQFLGINILWDFVSGGTGRGSYYFPVMIQVVLLLPIIQWIIKKSPYWGVIAFFALNILYEICKTVLNMDIEVYRILSLRYIFALAYGVFLYYFKIQKRKVLCGLVVSVIGFVGLIYILVFRYMGFVPVITNYWTATSVFAVMYIVPIMMVLISKATFLHNKLLELLGKSSYNIFLVQMVYYLAGDEIINKLCSIVLVRVILNILICCSVGIGFYFIETPITKKIVHFVLNSKANAN